MTKKKTTTKKAPKKSEKTGKNKPLELQGGEGLVYPEKYAEFIEWIATPSVLRLEEGMPKTQTELAKKIGVNIDSLTDWKKRTGFKEDVAEARSQFFTPRTSDVILSLETKCLSPSKVNGQDVRVYLTATGQYTEKVENEHIVSPELQQAIDKVADIL